MVCKKKRPVVLLEILISVGLLTVIIAAMLGYYRYVTILQVETEKVRELSFRKRLAHGRLSQVLSRLSKRNYVLYTDNASGQWITGDSLVFSYDNGAVVDTRFSGDVMGRLFLEPPRPGALDEGGRLCLATWPRLDVAPEGEVVPMTHEVLIEGVEELGFEFYYAYSKGRDGIADEFFTQIAVEDQEENLDLPFFITLVVMKKGVPIRFTVPIPAVKQLIRYPSD